MTEPEQDIIAFIANETGTERSSVRLSSRLAQASDWTVTTP
jgi:hypothetical protein